MLAVLFLNSMISRRRKACKADKAVKSETMTPDQVHCRTCLSSDNLVALFESKGCPKKRSKDLFSITGLHIKLNDGLSQKICIACVEALGVALRFRRTSRKSHKALKGGLPILKSHTNTVKGSIPPDKNPCEKPKPKVENLENGDGYDDYMAGDDFQNHDDYKVEEDVKVTKVEQQTSEPPVKKKRMDIPNASSYKCTWCSKEFRMKATFKAHMRFHTNYCVCEACGKRCRNNNQLQEHKRARHGLGKIHKCAYCEYSSATKEALTIHERRHTGERPYICDHCGASFHRRSNLVQHIAIHLPDKNFQCDLCPKRLQSRKLLQIHKHNAHTGKRYKYLCAVCAHRFEKPNKVRAHTRRVHGLPDHRQPPVVRVPL